MARTPRHSWSPDVLQLATSQHAPPARNKTKRSLTKAILAQALV